MRGCASGTAATGQVAGAAAGTGAATLLLSMEVAIIGGVTASLVTYLTVERPTSRLRDVGRPRLSTRPGAPDQSVQPVRPTA